MVSKGKLVILGSWVAGAALPVIPTISRSSVRVSTGNEINKVAIAGAAVAIRSNLTFLTYEGHPSHVISGHPPLVLPSARLLRHPRRRSRRYELCELSFHGVTGVTGVTLFDTAPEIDFPWATQHWVPLPAETRRRSVWICARVFCDRGLLHSRVVDIGRVCLFESLWPPLLLLLLRLFFCLWPISTNSASGAYFGTNPSPRTPSGHARSSLSPPLTVTVKATVTVTVTVTAICKLGFRAFCSFLGAALGAGARAAECCSIDASWPRFKPFFFCAKRYLAFGVSPASDLHHTNAQRPAFALLLLTFFFALLLRIRC